MKEKEHISNVESAIGLSDFLGTIDTMGVGLSIVDAKMEDLPLVYVNKGFLEMTGYSKEEVLLRNCRFLQGEGTDKRQVNTLRRVIEECKTETITLKNYRKDGSYFWNQFIISPIFDDTGDVVYYIGLQFDITSQVEEELDAAQKIKDLSDFDQLTGLMKLNNFKRALQLQIKNNFCPGALLRINLNRFRNINNSYGESVSDEVLIEVANRLRRVFPDVPIARSFADEYIVLHNLDSISLENALLAVEQELKKPYLLLAEKVVVGFSIGISQYPENGTNEEALLSFAELAMREAKKDSTMNYRFFNEELAKKLKTRMYIEKNFAQALRNQEFLLHYQPKVDAKTSAITGMEALIRWEDPTKGLISPVDFIPIAEETGFVMELGEWVLMEACRTNRKWQDKGLRSVPVSVNVSAVQFMHPNFTTTVKNVLKETELDAAYLELEITETMLIDPSIIIKKLKELKGIGVSISIDDFGTGYSSIQYLKDLPIDTLKIDRTFVMETPLSRRDNALLLSIIQLGKSLELSVLAEGVESEAQVAFLQKSSCDYIQGYYFSRPLDEAAMAAKLS